MELKNKAMLRMLNEVSEFNSEYPKEKRDEIIKAMSIIDRKLFVPLNLQNSAYEDEPLPIGEGQTISQPSTVARMILISELCKGASILEIGGGSGWNAALMSYLVSPGKVTAVERIDFLTSNAKKNVEKLKKNISSSEKKRINNLIFITEDALNRKSSIWNQKYDRIIITAGIEKNDSKTNKIIGEMASKLLKEKGMLICPQTVGPLQIYKKERTVKKSETREEYVFVPLLEGTA